MAQATSLKKVIWALDAFEDSKDLRSHSIDALKSITQGHKVEIEPVYVLSPDQLDLPLEFTPPWVDRYRPAAERRLFDLNMAREIVEAGA